MTFLSLLFYNCTSYELVHSGTTGYLDYANPDVGKFKYIKHNIVGKAVFSEENSGLNKGSKEWVDKISNLSKEALKDLIKNADLQDNQALYNIKIDQPTMIDRKSAGCLSLFGATLVYLYIEVSISADVIEFID